MQLEELLFCEGLVEVAEPAEVVEEDHAAGGDAGEEVLEGLDLGLGGVHVDVEVGDLVGDGLGEGVGDGALDDADVGVGGEGLADAVDELGVFEMFVAAPLAAFFGGGELLGGAGEGVVEVEGFGDGGEVEEFAEDGGGESAEDAALDKVAGDVEAQVAAQARTWSRHTRLFSWSVSAMAHGIHEVGVAEESGVAPEGDEHVGGVDLAGVELVEGFEGLVELGDFFGGRP